jgi:hypothetical protein
MTSRYDDTLNELRQKGERLANQYIVELYNILRDEEKMPPEDCRDKIEHDCVDLWSKATIRKYLPPESKDPKKRQAGKMGGDKKKKAMLLVAQNTAGEGGARTVLAENDSDNQNKQESQTFYSQLNQQLEARQPTQELYDVSKMFDDKDREIERLKLEIEELQDKLMIKNEGENDIVILPTDLLSEMISASRREGTEEIKQFYLKAKHGKVIGYETDFRRIRDNNENTTAAYMLNNDDNNCKGVDLHSAQPL